ncbi:hypothetical protein Tco_1544769 [Tanacetum coccineum]
MKRSKETKKESENDALYLAFKSPIMTLCFIIAEAVHFRPVYKESFGKDEESSVGVSGWSTLLPNYSQNATKKSFFYEATTISHYIPMEASGANFVQTCEDIKLVGDLAEEELDLVNGEWRDGEIHWIPALMRLLDCPKACDFVVKLKWMFLEVKELKLLNLVLAGNTMTIDIYLRLAHPYCRTGMGSETIGETTEISGEQQSL